jgi:hypothetical protein
MGHAVDVEYHTAHVELKPDGPNFYAGEVSVPQGGVFRYAYDRWNGEGCCEARNEAREVLFNGDPTRQRLLYVEPGLSLVEDVVPEWNDLPTEFEQYEVSGRIVDDATFEPLIDVELTVAGIHVATNANGEFTVPGVPSGRHRAVAYTVKDGYRPVQQELLVRESALSGIDIQMSRTEMVRVEFETRLPANTPPDLAVFVAGNMWDLGGRPAGPNNPAVPSGISMPMMNRTGDTARLAVDLPVGAYVEYFYTLGPDVTKEGHENRSRHRNFVVGNDEPKRTDAVSYWGNEGWPLTTIRVDVPPNTPEGVPIYWRAGPTYRMNQVSPFQWTTAVISHPEGSDHTFGISLGDDHNGTDAAGDRTVNLGPVNNEIAVKVEKWTNLADTTLRNDSNGLTVTFRLSIPEETPENPTILLLGSRPAVGTNGTTMQPVPGNPSLYEAKVTFGHDGPLNYRYAVVETGLGSEEQTVGTDYDGQVINDYVSSWSGTSSAGRDGWISGIYTPDFWSEAFLPASASTFEAAVEANGEWVAISSVWSFGQIQPEPFVESRPVRIWTVLTPIDDIRAQAAVAREKGLKVFLAPQMNPEVLPNWQDETVSAGSREWWDQWLEQAESQWLWNATVAEEIDAELLLLPGYVFHVFPPPDFFQDERYAPEFDLKVQELIGKVREVYSGKLLISGSQTAYDFPGLADYIGVTTYDLGVPELPADASLADLRAHYAPAFRDKVDVPREKWGKPILFYTIHAPSRPQADDEFGQLFQATAYEAMFQEIADRPFVTGSFTWAWDMVGASQFETDGVRDRTAEAVMAKWYALLSGR